MKTWGEFITAFGKLAVYRGDKYKPGSAPHKPCMLLAVIDLIEEGDIGNNQIRYSPHLLDKFDHYFKFTTADISDQIDYGECQACYPFVNLDRESFWNLHQSSNSPLNFSHSERNKLAKSGPSKISEKVNFASLDDRLFHYLSKPELRQSARQSIIENEKWSPHQQTHMWAAVRDAQAQKQFEREFFENLPELPETVPFEAHSRRLRMVAVRDSQFRRGVLQAYNFRCAATGWQLNTNKGGSLLEAAHIIPFAESSDNRLQNGLALVPTVHKAMDNRLISPGPDLMWHASEFLMKAAKFDEGAKWLWNLHRKPINLPQNEWLRPGPSVLGWRYEQLLN